MVQAGTEGLAAAAQRVRELGRGSVSTLGMGRFCTSDTQGMPAGLRETSADVMLSTPKTLPARASVDDVRAQMADDHVHMVLLTDGGKLRGTVVRTDLPPSGSGHEAALGWAVLRDRTVHPDAPVALVRARLNHTRTRRLAVVDVDHTLLGLVCLKRSRSGFCADADVAARRAATANHRTENPREKHLPDGAR